MINPSNLILVLLLSLLTGCTTLPSFTNEEPTQQDTTGQSLIAASSQNISAIGNRTLANESPYPEYVSIVKLPNLHVTTKVIKVNSQ